jgi:hypothetical protein
MNRRPMQMNRGTNNGSGGGNGSGNNRFRRGSSNHQRGRSNGGMDHEQEGDAVSSHQRRHAQNQQSKYQDMARNARQSGDRVETEYYLQHVEHYTRVIALSDMQQRERDDARGGANPRHSYRDETEEAASPESQDQDKGGYAPRQQRERQHHPRRDDGRTQQRFARPQEPRVQQHPEPETPDADDRAEGSEQRRRLRPFRQPRLPMNERQDAPVVSHAEYAETPAPHHESQEAEPAVRAGRGRPRKPFVPTDPRGGIEENHGMTLAGVLPKGDF